MGTAATQEKRQFLEDTGLHQSAAKIAPVNRKGGSYILQKVLGEAVRMQEGQTIHRIPHRKTAKDAKQVLKRHSLGGT